MSRIRWQGVPGALAIVLTGVLVFANVFGNGWHYDDKHSITENPHLRSLEDPGRFFTDPAQFSRDADKGMFRPLVPLSFALNYAWSGLDTRSWHVVNLALHLACGLLLWRILLRLGRTPGLALTGALLFTVHPLATEPVNYISSRSESMAALFVLAAFLLHLRARTATAPWDRAASVVSFACGVLVKSVAITTPVLLVLHDGQRDGWRQALRPRRLAPYVLVAAGYLAIVGGHVSRAVVTEAVRGPWAQLATQIKAGPYYAKLLTFPVGLSVHHQFFEGGLPLVVLLSLAMVASLVGWTLRGGGRDVILGLAWAALVLAPTVIVPLNVLVNDHRLYLPLAGLVIAGTALSTTLRRPIVVGVLLAAVVALGARSRVRNQVWENEHTLWTDVAAKSPYPAVPVAEVHLGNFAKDAGRPDEAIRYFERALEIAPGHMAARNNMGIALQQLGRVDEAIDVYEAIVREAPELAEGWYNLGKAYQQRATGETGESALQDYDRARLAYLRVEAGSVHHYAALNNLGTVFEAVDVPASALLYYRRSLSLRPGFADAQRNVMRLARELPARAQALLAAGRLVDLERLCEQWLLPGPGASAGTERDALLFLAASRLYQGRYEDSLDANRRLVQRFPSFEEGYLQLGNLYETRGQREQAIQVYEQQLQRRPDGALAGEAARRLAALAAAAPGNRR